jgi:hypothetical protein
MHVACQLKKAFFWGSREVEPSHPRGATGDGTPGREPLREGGTAGFSQISSGFEAALLLSRR